VLPKARGVLDGGVAVWCKLFYELFEGNNAGFFEAVHAVAYLDGRIVLVVESDGVFVDDFVGNVFAIDAHVLVVGHWGAKVVIMNVHAEVTGTLVRIGDDTVEVDFGV
jgi:hypothetical protein